MRFEGRLLLFLPLNPGHNTFQSKSPANAEPKNNKMTDKHVQRLVLA